MHTGLQHWTLQLSLSSARYVLKLHFTCVSLITHGPEVHQDAQETSENCVSVQSLYLAITDLYQCSGCKLLNSTCRLLAKLLCSLHVTATCCRGCVLLNGAGRIEDVQTAVEAPVAAALSDTEKGTLAAIDPKDFSSLNAGSNQDTAKATASSQASASQAASTVPKSSKQQVTFWEQVTAPLATMAKRVAVYGSFMLTKQPSRVKQVLRQVRTQHT